MALSELSATDEGTSAEEASHIRPVLIHGSGDGRESKQVTGRLVRHVKDDRQTTNYGKDRVSDKYVCVT